MSHLPSRASWTIYFKSILGNLFWYFFIFITEPYRFTVTICYIFLMSWSNINYLPINLNVFGVQQVEYLCHFISKERVSIDPNKIQAVQQWPTPTNRKQLRGFLGLAGYYSKFIRNYGLISRPFTDLIKNIVSHGLPQRKLPSMTWSMPSHML